MDPLAEQFPAWNPYHYVHNNPINLVDPTGMSAQNPGEGETTLPNTTLPETTINATRPTFSGYAKSLHLESSDKGSRLSGYNIYERVGGLQQMLVRIQEVMVSTEGNWEPMQELMLQKEK